MRPRAVETELLLASQLALQSLYVHMCVIADHDASALRQALEYLNIHGCGRPIVSSMSSILSDAFALGYLGIGGGTVTVVRTQRGGATRHSLDLCCASQKTFVRCGPRFCLVFPGSSEGTVTELVRFRCYSIGFF